MVGFEPWSGFIPVLDSVTYCYVPIPCLPCYLSPRLSHRTGPSAHPGITCLRPSISRHRTRSSAHLGVNHLQPSITEFLVFCPSSYPLNLLLPLPCFLQDFILGCPQLYLHWHLTPPRVPPDSSPLIALLSCTHIKTRLQIHPLCHRPLLSPYTIHCRLSPHRFLHYLCPGSHPPYVFLPLSPLPCDLPHKTCVCALHLLSITAKSTPVPMPEIITLYATALYNSAATLGSTPSLLNIFHNLPQTILVCLMFNLISSQSSSVWSMGRSRYFKVATPSNSARPYPPYRMNSISTHLSNISTSLHLIHIYIPLLHIFVCPCLRSRVSGICIPQ